MGKICEICKYKDDKENLILETVHWRLALGNDQAYLGRSYLSVKRHVGSLAELSKEEWKELQELIPKIEKTYAKKFGAKVFNWACLMNNAFQEKPYNPHVHWHLRPRYESPVEFSGETFQDRTFGHFYDREHKQIASPQVKQKIIAKLKESF